MAKKRSRTREARQRRRKQRQQNKRLLVLAAIVVVALVGIAVFVVSNQPVEAFMPDDLSQRYESIQRSYSPDGYPRLGDPDAPVTVEEYASFSCPGCETLHSNSLDALLERVRDGQALFTYVPLQTGAVPNAAGAARAALCAGQQAMFWEMHDVLFDWQTRYGNTAFSQNRLLAGVESLGLNGGAFTNCFNSAAISATLDAALNENVAITPTIRVNGVTIDAAQAIPSTAAILEAIDGATPADWWTRNDPVLPEQEAPPATETPALAATAEVEAPADAATPVDDAESDLESAEDSDAESAAEPEAESADEATSG